MKEQTNGERFEEFMNSLDKYPELEGTNALCDDIIKKRTGKMTEEEWQAAERAQTSKRTNMTAVELLKQDIDLEIKSGTKMVVNWDMYLEMEKQQIIDAAERWKGTDFAEQYYNETYGSKGSEHHIVDTNEMVSSQTSEQIAIDFAEWLLDYNPTMLYQKTKKELFKEWNECSTSSQTERIYSEEEVLEIVSNCDGSISQAKKWFEQFKKK